MGKTSRQKFKDWILEKSHQYMQNIQTEEESVQEEDDPSKEVKIKRKANPEDKERKRLKRKKLKEEKLNTRKENEVNKALASKNALDYLHEWELRRDSWSFKKKRQIWLIRHLYDNQQISDDDFKILLKYLENIQGNLRAKILSEAEDIIKEYDRQSESNETSDTETHLNCSKDLQEYKYNRARMLIQILV
ncbi:uncharacterized protein C7orf50 homolog [Centruroides sculpturatus]|uniref:uncharacterized protein C7orf50 homolog n=1 Tax=Centruroides sculpturatus TaxID=218467 RepID=UPI000C6EEF80|nr:uncharacterized protein C7orf50 homolog [Centruroides sculpturatus]XP_023226375.1 uncharacterized protein C7orf50 homolog [Centruroides sculpturatus]